MLLVLDMLAGFVTMSSHTNTSIGVRVFLAIVCEVWQFSTSCFIFQACLQHWQACDLLVQTNYVYGLYPTVIYINLHGSLRPWLGFQLVTRGSR
jgi:hypothetical protein